MNRNQLAKLKLVMHVARRTRWQNRHLQKKRAGAIFLPIVSLRVQWPTCAIFSLVGAETRATSSHDVISTRMFVFESLTSIVAGGDRDATIYFKRANCISARID